MVGLGLGLGVRVRVTVRFGIGARVRVCVRVCVRWGCVRESSPARTCTMTVPLSPGTCLGSNEPSLPPRPSPSPSLPEPPEPHAHTPPCAERRCASEG